MIKTWTEYNRSSRCEFQSPLAIILWEISQWEKSEMLDGFVYRWNIEK